jgi:hypothetical protein
MLGPTRSKEESHSPKANSYLPWTINTRGGVRIGAHHSPKDESLPSKERPLLGRLESRERESCIPKDACSSIRIK